MFDPNRVLMQVQATDAANLARDVLHDLVARTGEKEAKAVASAVLGLAFAGVKNGLGALIPPFLRPLAFAGLDAGMRASATLMSNFIAQVAREPDPNPNTK